MSESVGTPFTGYNQTSAPKVLTGNYFEERALLSATGVARRRPVVVGAGGADDDATTGATDASPRSPRGGGGGGGGVFASPRERAANAVQPATFKRVMEHSEQQDPKSWASHARQAHAPPAALRDALPGSFRGAAAAGPREAEELARLRRAAAADAAAEAAGRDADAAAAIAAGRGTAYAEAFKAPPLEGLTLGTRVMMTRDGGPVTRDVEFLVEANLVSRATAGRVFTRQAAFRRRGGDAEAGGEAEGEAGGGVGALGSWGGAAAAAQPVGDEPVTIYSYDSRLPQSGTAAASTAAAPGAPGALPVAAAATSAGGGSCALKKSFYGTGGPKSRPMARSDAFTKLPGDVNKRADG